MVLVKEILVKTEKSMSFKDINYFDNLSEREKINLFFPQMIFSFAEKSAYPYEEAYELAGFSQLLFFSIQLHDKILEAKGNPNLLILEGDHLFSLVFKKIITSKHEKHILKFTNYIKNLSEKRILCIDGLLDKNEVDSFKFKEVSRIIAEIVGKNNPVLLDLSQELSELLLEYLNNDDYGSYKNAWMKTYFSGKNQELQDITLEIIKAMEGDMLV